MTNSHIINIFKNYCKHQRNNFYYEKIENMKVKKNGE